MVDMLSLVVKGMACEGCALAVRSVLEGVTGVRSVEVDRERGVAVVRGALGQADLGRLAAAVRYLGYEAGPARAREPEAREE